MSGSAAGPTWLNGEPGPRVRAAGPLRRPVRALALAALAWAWRIYAITTGLGEFMATAPITFDARQWKSGRSALAKGLTEVPGAVPLAGPGRRGSRSAAPSAPSATAGTRCSPSPPRRAPGTWLNKLEIPTVTVSGSIMTLFRKTIKGSLFGDCNPTTDIPKILGLYQAGDLKLDEIITRTYTLDEVNEGYDDLLAGKNVRGVIVHEH